MVRKTPRWASIRGERPFLVEHGIELAEPKLKPDQVHPRAETPEAKCFGGVRSEMDPPQVSRGRHNQQALLNRRFGSCGTEMRLFAGSSLRFSDRRRPS